ncbi:MAG: hypothetical protein Q8909_07380 [Bacteroidota bacterium]|nr:hypothetical protein [Bacteroidota bacterium]
MNNIESILRFELRPWLNKNLQPDDYYSPELRSNPLIKEEFTPQYKLVFGVSPFSIRTKFYQRLIDNDISGYLNSFFKEIDGKSSNLIAYQLKKIKEKIYAFLKEINELIGRNSFDLSLIGTKICDFSVDRAHKESTFIFHYMLSALIKCYLEIQNRLSAHIHDDDKMGISDIYCRILNKPLPEYIYIQEILTLSIEQENEINARKPEPESTYVAQFAKEKHSAFMAVISPYLFMELPKIKDLNPKAQNRLLKEILENNICYSVAMLSYLGYLDYLKKTYNLSKEMIYKHISKALKTDTRTIKGNCLVLNPNSKEDRYKYQADQFIEKVELDYNYISSGKPLV